MRSAGRRRYFRLVGRNNRRRGVVQCAIAYCTLLLTACTASDPEAQHQHYQFFAEGTTVDLDFYGVAPEQAQKAQQAVVEDLRYMQNAWHPTKAGTLGRVNQMLPLQAAFHTAPSVIKLVEISQRHYRNSGGLFNPAIGGLVQLWGFNQDDMQPTAPPAADRIKALVEAHPGMDDITVKGTAIKSNNPKVQLDFGGVAKGYGVDLVIEHLRELGVHNAIVNAGGDLRAIGSKGGKPWHIGIKHPRQSGMLAAIDMQGDEVIVTSGDYERFYEYQGRRYHHVLDPRTGYPTEQVQSVTVLHHSAADADAIATALMVAGPTDWVRVAKKMGAEHVMLIDSAGTVHITPALRQRLEFRVEPLPKIVETPL